MSDNRPNWYPSRNVTDRRPPRPSGAPSGEAAASAGQPRGDSRQAWAMVASLLGLLALPLAASLVMPWMGVGLSSLELGPLVSVLAIVAGAVAACAGSWGLRLGAAGVNRARCLFGIAAGASSCLLAAVVLLRTYL